MRNSTFFNIKSFAEHNINRIFAAKIRLNMMKKTIIITVLAAITIGVLPTKASNFEAVADNGQTMVEENRISVNVQGSSVLVNGAAGYTMEVVSLTGRPVIKIKVENNSQRVDLNVNKGCYIVKIENQAKTKTFVRKVTIL